MWLLRSQFCAIALVAGIGLACDHSAALAKGKRTCAALKIVDRDNDGTVDLNEINRAADAAFGKLDKNKDGTLSPRELHGRLSGSEFKAVDRDSDGTLSRDEYLAAVRARFNAADINGEGTVSCREAESSAGRALLALSTRQPLLAKAR